MYLLIAHMGNGMHLLVKLTDQSPINLITIIKQKPIELAFALTTFQRPLTTLAHDKMNK